ncbi:MAG: DUF1549 domain-containing protein [Planctomycetaceae bacterium]|nr:DUF1549 domain-containing protein [Planctomycetaceae bacterium]
MRHALTTISFCFLFTGITLQAAEPVKFSRDILPILSDRCFHCHGPDAAHREADLRLDLRDDAIKTRDGHQAITPGKPDASELLKRITAEDEFTLMPPPDSHRKPLTEQQIATFRQWIAEGAEWGRHWSFEKPTRPKLPDENIHPIDAFVQRKLKQAGLTPSPTAAPATLMRRLSFDLTGLPPSPEEVKAFTEKPSAEEYEKVVNQLLSSPHYGERMAMWWLDASRYSDTDGYQQDSTRNNWPWRDWVIDSFNQNKPFDEFTVEQFAGDLLDNPTPEQILATCFHRNHMTNGEGGRDPEESRIDYVRDRVNTTGTVFLGLTLECAQCHSHKFDPISQQDYYSLTAFFNSIDETGKAGGAANPYHAYTSPYSERSVKEAEQIVAERQPLESKARKAAEAEFEPWLKQQLERVQQHGFQPWTVLQATDLNSVEGTPLRQNGDGIVIADGTTLFQDDYKFVASVPVRRLTGLKLEVFPHASHTEERYTRGGNGEFILTDVKLQIHQRGSSQLTDIELDSAVADVEKKVSGRNYGLVKDTLDDDPRNGWTTEGIDEIETRTALFALAEPLELADDEELIFVMLHRSTTGNANIGRFRLSVTDQVGEAVRSLEPMPLDQLAAEAPETVEAITPEIRKRLLNQFLTDHDEYQAVKAALDRANRQLAEIKKMTGNIRVQVLKRKAEPRTTHVLVRGVWDKKGEVVTPNVPDAILNLNDETEPSRLDLARWIVSSENPLTARVIVNQLWQLCFGTGLVRTPSDFGLQGEQPTHPDLLDWLAVEFMESGWDVKHILKLIVTSQTYQQSSDIMPELLQHDPENRLLARAPRFRLPSWMIRDAWLKSSGLLNPALGGPPVYPYQPEGVWNEMFMGRFTYQPSQGEAQYRRTVYAFWRRSAAPTFLFDAAQRRVCEVRPRRTNTPLHALTLLNDRTSLEASRHLAEQVISQDDAPVQRTAFLTRRILSRPPTEREADIIQRKWKQTFEYYRKNTDEASRLLDVGQLPRTPTKQDAELATWMVTASMIYNLDEAITHE